MAKSKEAINLSGWLSFLCPKSYLSDIDLMGREAIYSISTVYVEAGEKKADRRWFH
jgi:hypothetical protein